MAWAYWKDTGELGKSAVTNARAKHKQPMTPMTPPTPETPDKATGLLVRGGSTISLVTPHSNPCKPLKAYPQAKQGW